MRKATSLPKRRPSSCSAWWWTMYGSRVQQQLQLCLMQARALDQLPNTYRARS
jgi:hypothetical protein